MIAAGQRRRHRDHRPREADRGRSSRRWRPNADWSPYQGWSLAGFAETTFCRGRKIVDDYRFVGESGWGRWLPRERAGSLDAGHVPWPMSDEPSRPRAAAALRAPRQESSMFRAGERRSLEELTRGSPTSRRRCPRDEARVEAARCLFCFDAPCTRACPTHIDVPRFIRQILHRDEIGAARTILEANIFGGSCARACPTEVLCEGACVDRTADEGAGADRPAAAVRLRRRRGPGRPVLRAGPADGQAGGRDRLGTGRAELRPRAAPARARRRRLRGPRRAGRPRHARHRRLQDLDRVRPGRDRDDPRRSASTIRARPSRHGRRGPATARRVRRRLPRHRPGPDRCRWGSRAKSSTGSGRRSTSSSRPTRGRSPSATSGRTSW